MRNISVRTAIISALAIAGAVIWGAAETIALQWAQFRKRLHAPGKFRAF